MSELKTMGGFWGGTVVGLVIGIAAGLGFFSLHQSKSVQGGLSQEQETRLAGTVAAEVALRLHQPAATSEDKSPVAAKTVDPTVVQAPGTASDVAKPPAPAVAQPVAVETPPAAVAQPVVAPPVPVAPVVAAPASPPPAAAQNAANSETLKENMSSTWQSRVTEYATEKGSSPAVGSNQALVKVFVISDFQCPVCKRAAAGTEELLEQFGDEVQFIFWNNPLDMHSKAMPMAQAAMAAHRQGKFWEYHHLMFQNQSANSAADFEAYASQLGLNMDQFRADMASQDTVDKLRSDQAAAEAMQARGTPAFLVNGRLQVGWGSTSGIEHMIKMEMDAVKSAVGGGLTLEKAMEERAERNAKSPELKQLYVDYFLHGKPAARAQ